RGARLRAHEGRGRPGPRRAGPGLRQPCPGRLSSSGPGGAGARPARSRVPKGAANAGRALLAGGFEAIVLLGAVLLGPVWIKPKDWRSPHGRSTAMRAEEQFRLVLVVAPAAKGDVGDGGRPLQCIGLDVVELQE